MRCTKAVFIHCIVATVMSDCELQISVYDCCNPAAGLKGHIAWAAIWPVLYDEPLRTLERC